MTKNFKACGRSIIIGNRIKSLYLGGWIIDIGCSTGYLERDLLDKHSFKVIGVDIDFESLRIAKNSCRVVIQADAKYLPFKKKICNFIVCMETLEHIDEDQKVLKQLDAIINDKGYILITVPSYKLRFLDPVNWIYYIRNLLRIKTKHYHLRHYRPSDIIKHFKQYNIIEIRFAQLLTIPISLLYGFVPAEIRKIIRFFFDPLVTIDYKINYNTGICLIIILQKNKGI